MFRSFIALRPPELAKACICALVLIVPGSLVLVAVLSVLRLLQTQRRTRNA
jgi:hypothetical protein